MIWGYPYFWKHPHVVSVFVFGIPSLKAYSIQLLKETPIWFHDLRETRKNSKDSSSDTSMLHVKTAQLVKNFEQEEFIFSFTKTYPFPFNLYLSYILFFPKIGVFTPQNGWFIVVPTLFFNG